MPVACAWPTDIIPPTEFTALFPHQPHERVGSRHPASAAPEGEFFLRAITGERKEEKGIKAAYKDGVLKVVLPKKEEAKPRQIKIDVAQA